jgi:hypothetical protein
MKVTWLSAFPGEPPLERFPKFPKTDACLRADLEFLLWGERGVSHDVECI